MKTISKAVALLDRFTEQSTVLGVTDLARATGLDKSVVHGLLRSLVDNGLVERVPEMRKYRLGHKMLSYGQVRAASMPVISCARDKVRELRDAIGESAQMSLYLGDAMQVAVAYETELPTRVAFRPGRSLPVHCTAAGIAVLSALPEDQLEAFFAEPLRRLDNRPDMLMDPEQVRHLVEEARARGASCTVRTYTSDVASVGAAILDAAGRPIAAIAVAGPLHRMNRDRLNAITPAVRKAAARVSAEMGYISADRAA